MPITVTFPVLNRQTDGPEVFSTKADALSAALAIAGPQMNALEANVNNKEESAVSAAASASASAELATTKAEIAVSAAEGVVAAVEAATTATDQAEIATTKAAEATTAKNDAVTAKNAAQSAQTGAESVKNTAVSAKDTAVSAKDTAVTAASTATTKASEASTHASDAQGYASTASGAAGMATSKASEAATSFTNFNKRYLGEADSNPTLDNQGTALVTGALYYNSTAYEMRVYTGSAWSVAYVPSGLSAVNASSPMASTGGTTPTISMHVADVSHDGYLSLGDWATFNSKVDGSDTRLSNARAPTSHTHGNITNGGLVGVTSGIPLITGTGGIVQAGSFGSGGGTFCQGNDARLSDSRAADDVYTWAKAATKPSYTYSEVGAQVAGSYPTGSGTCSGTNTGDQTLPTLSSLGGLPKSGGAMTGATVSLREAHIALGGTAIDLATGNSFSKTITTTTTFTLSNIPASGQAYCFFLFLTNGGAYTVNLFSGVKWNTGVDHTLTSSGLDMLAFITTDGGSTWTGSIKKGIA